MCIDPKELVQTENKLMKKHRITGFLNVFETKVDNARKRIKQELEKPKEERNKKFLKQLLKEAKDLRNLVREMKEDHKVEVTCPHCEKSFEL